VRKLKDAVARERFLAEEGTVETALQLVPPKKGETGLVGDIEELTDILRRYPWTTLAELKGNQEVILKLEETEKLIRELKKALAK
jgi:hypothetical protein